MRALERVGIAVWAAMVGVACTNSPSGAPASPSPVVSTTTASPSASPSRLEELRASDQYVEFAEHERAARAPYARLAWENFAPIVDGQRVEWANKAELWDSIAPKIRDEALLLGPEYREPLWDNTNAIPNGVSMVWNDKDTEDRGHFVEFTATYQGDQGPAIRYWGFLIEMESTRSGRVVGRMPPFDVNEDHFGDYAAAHEEASHREWAWITQQGAD